MKQLLFLLILATTLLGKSFGLDERKTDLFYANGVWAADRSVEEKQWKIKVENFQDLNPNQNNYIGRKELAYNASYSTTIDNQGVAEVLDLYEEFVQSVNGGVKMGSMKAA